MEAVVEQIQQTYDMQVSGYYRQLHLVESYLHKEKKISLETDNNRNFFKAWEKESESTLLFLQENGKAITSDGTKLKVDMPSKLLLDYSTVFPDSVLQIKKLNLKKETMSFRQWL